METENVINTSSGNRRDEARLTSSAFIRNQNQIYRNIAYLGGGKIALSWAASNYMLPNTDVLAWSLGWCL